MKMKSKSFLFAAAVMAMYMTAACTESGETGPEDVDISLTVDDGGYFDGGSYNVSLYVVAKAEASAEAVSGDRLVDGTVVTVEDGTVNVAADPELTCYDFYCIFPEGTSAVPSGAESFAFSLPCDQDKNAPQELLFGKAVNYAMGEGTPEVVLGKQLARVSFVVETEEEFGKAPSAVMKNLSLDGQFNVVSAAFEPGKAAGSITPAGDFAFGSGAYSGVGAVVVPQTVAAGTEVAVITCDGTGYKVQAPEEMVIEAGRDYELKVVVEPESSTVLNVTVSVSDWTDESLSFVDDEVVAPQGDVVVDIDGNEYPIVKIGDQYWMGSNFRATRLNDGTPIRKIETLDNWPVVDESAYTAYEFGFDDERLGYLYNRYSVDTGKLCPKGWHLPSEVDWDRLAMTMGGTPDEAHCFDNVTEGLKSTDGWAANPGTNETGFDGYPGGYLYCTEDYSSGELVYNKGFYYEGVYASWWSMTGWATGNYFNRSFTASGSTMQRYAASRHYGFYIRCVHDK